MNAKKELQNKVKKLDLNIKCAKVYKDLYYENDSIDYFLLPVRYSDIELKNFYKKLDFEYESGYGSQELFGCVWFTDGTWLTRGEYDGSEWWEHHSVPNIPQDLRKPIFSNK